MKTENEAPSSYIELTSPRLRLKIVKPGTSYQSTRFDYSSFAISLIVDDKYECLGYERNAKDNLVDPLGGQGLCCEFGIHSPIGYTDCAIGDWFPKIGVGFIRRESAADYDFFHNYAELRPLNYQYNFDLPKDAPPQSQAFTIEGKAAEYRGYAWTMKRTWLVYGNTVENRCSLTNTGSKNLTTTEYSHNFIRLGETLIGPRYELGFGFPINPNPPAHADPSQCLDGLKPVFTKVPQGEFYLGELQISIVSQASWTIRNLDLGCSIQESLSQTCTKAALWGKASVISPELFINLDLAPGQSQNWSRIYRLAP